MVNLLVLLFFLIGFISTSNGFVLSKNCVVEDPLPAKVVSTKAKVDEADTQLSLFDLFEKNTNK